MEMQFQNKRMGFVFATKGGYGFRRCFVYTDDIAMSAQLTTTNVEVFL